jgi:hypothetical protein
MGKASKGKEEFGRREKIAAQRAAAKRAEQRRNGLLIAGGAVIVVIAVVVAFIVVKANKSTNAPTTSTVSGAPTGANLTSIINQVTSVPTSATDAAAGGGSAVTPPTKISGSPLTSGGKPEVLFIGAEYCPYCAAERWGVIVALSRFGTFSGLQPMRSISSDVYPNTATWTFTHSSYTSNYITFTPVEVYTNYLTNGNYTPLQNPTAAQTALWKQYGNEAFPFIDLGGKDVVSGQSYSPQVLAGLSWTQIADDLTNSSSPVAQSINGTANYLTASICKQTGNLPATACTATVKGLEGSL